MIFEVIIASVVIIIVVLVIVFNVLLNDKINSSDRPIFEKSEGSENRYIKAYSDKHAEILSLSPYINDEMKFDSDYSILCTDTNGKYVNISTAEQIEIIDKYRVVEYIDPRDILFKNQE